MLDILTLFIAIAIFLSFLRFLKGNTLIDRVVAFDNMSIIGVSLLTILSIAKKESFYLDIAFVFALIGFIGTIIFAKFNKLKVKND